MPAQSAATALPLSVVTTSLAGPDERGMNVQKEHTQGCLASASSPILRAIEKSTLLYTIDGL